MIAVEVDPTRIQRRLDTGYLDKRADTLDEALRLANDAIKRKEPLSIGLLGNCAEVLPEMLRRGVKIDMLTDQTSAHDPLKGYIPAGMSVEQAALLRSGKLAEADIEHPVQFVFNAPVLADDGVQPRGIGLETGDVVTDFALDFA